ncbi:Retinoblastoma-associated protein, A-box [Ostreococcus tauri]|uniref:Retinoblastoma protein n=1 Tax=Ostreococcus tauri TaxID=70448 RepID=Q5SCB2_OSTTA|nr:Retinoblastoma-associated protein, A-box [Ostreococcus tauri]AAV68604.1 retinoblastoma protein [Ostreococcus tauri]CEG00420.1 Retinoblastoma-associated protein, A-box [Ostreococcus tauri]|eukprot:XP_003083679.2 Retinoblastoma-associated protein, A-box [Ostreococcus tauri]
MARNDASMAIRAVDGHARGDEARRVMRDVLDAARGTLSARGNESDGAGEGTRAACGALAALGLLDAEDAVRDGGATGAAGEGGDVTGVLEDCETTLVEVLDAMPEFLSAGARALATRLKSPSLGSSAVAEAERAMRLREMRSAFAFNKVIAKKFHEFIRVHFDADSRGGRTVARLGWAVYQCAKCEALPKFPDLYSCYHLLVAVEAFLLVNAPRELLRTSLKNMVSMTAKDAVTGLPDPLASLSSSSKTKVETVRAMSVAVINVLKATFPSAVFDVTSHFEDVAPSDACVRGVFDGDADVASPVMERYRRVAAETFGRLAVDETLYLYTEMEGEDSRGRKIIGDLASCATETTHGSMATPTRRKRAAAPFSPYRPKKISTIQEDGGMSMSPMRAIRGPLPAGVVPPTPISQAMASASWLQDIVCASSDLETKLAELRRFVPGEETVIDKLHKKVDVLGQRLGQAIREDALVTTMRTDISPHSMVMDELVRQRTTELVHIFFFFLNRILRAESQVKKDANIVALLQSSRFTKSLLACCMEVIVATYKTSTLTFPATTHLLGIHPFDLTTIIEPFVRADMDLPREIVRHFNSLEEKTLERLAWCKGSALFDFLQSFQESVNRGGTTSTSTSNPRATSIPKRPVSPMFNVAAIAEVAAMGEPARDAAAEKDLVMPQCHSPVRRPPTSAFTVFSSPLRGATTPRRKLPGGQPLPERFAAVRNHDVEQPIGCDVCAFKALQIFFAKVMQLAARRLGDLASRLKLSPEVTRDVYALIEHVIYEQTNLVYNRHVDQIILASVYGVCKVNGGCGGAVQFKDIIYQYSKQPQCTEEIFWTVVIEQTDPELEVSTRGDIISFYNKVFVSRVRTFLLALRERAEALAAQKTTDGEKVSVDEPFPFGISSPRRRLPVENQNIYVSPMRPEREAAMLQDAAVQGEPSTPRTRSLFATIGESIHGDPSSANDFEAINKHLAMKATSTPSRLGARVPEFSKR